MSCLSIVIVCYNQQRFVCDCLNSLLCSDTSEVEVIITDDHSLDNSVELAKDWILNNSFRFERTYINELEKHCGTVKNIVSGVGFVKSPIVKLIAADDWFLPKAVDYIKYYCKNNVFDVAFSPVKIARIVGNKYEIQDDFYNASDNKLFFNLNNKEQFNVVLRHNCLKAPGAFFTIDFWYKIRLTDTPVVVMEDWAMWLKGLALNGHYVQIGRPIVVYRENMESVSSNSRNLLYKTYLRDHIITMWCVGFANKKLITLFTMLWMICTSIVINISLLMPCYCVNITNVIRNKCKRGNNYNG